MSHTIENSNATRVSMREGQAADARFLALLLRQPPDQNRDEDDVVDAENDLEQRQRDERQPGLRVGQQLHHAREGSGVLRQMIDRGLLHAREHVLGRETAVERHR